MKSKAIAVVGPKQVEVKYVDTPPVGEWDIKVELEVSAISVGTESHYIANNTIFPFIPGYLNVGTIVETGKLASTLFQTGDRVTYFKHETPEGYDNQWMCGHMSPGVV